MRGKTAGICFLVSSLFTGFLWSSEPQGLYLQVPYLRQTRNYCGPAVLAMVLNYWGVEIDQYTLAGQVDPFPSKGLSGDQLKQLAQQHSFRAYSFRGEAGFIRDQLRNGRPVIVVLGGGVFDRANHYVVLVGWDQEKESWLIHDPTRGPFLRMGESEMEKRREKLGLWSLLVLPGEGKD